LGRLEDTPVGFVDLPGPLSSMLETATEEKERRVSSIAVLQSPSIRYNTL
jgi:hypothetical protein